MLPTLALAALASALGANAQANDLSDVNNVTSLQGTWSTGNGYDTYITTGPTFCNPVAFTFNPPNNTGTSLSFTDDGFFEEAQYRFDANPANPECIAAKIWWQHGTYAFEGDSLVLTPWGSDGRIQVQNRCTSTTTQIYYYDEKTAFKDWGITIDPTTARYTLRVNRFDGAKMPPLYQIANPPNMLPTSPLTGINSSGQVNTRKRNNEHIFNEARSTGVGYATISNAFIGAGSTLAVVAAFAFSSLL